MYLHEIDAMMRAGRPFGEIEDRIDELPLDADAKSTLWLWAWVEIDRPARRRVVREMLDALAA